MTTPPRNRLFFRYLMLGLLSWGVLVALGTYLGPEFWTPSRTVSDAESTASEQPAVAEAEPARGLTGTFDYRKPLIVVTCVGVFLGGWALLLYGREKRLARLPAERRT
jgi:hypothetical protein